MLVVYRDDGFWILTWYRWSRRLIGGRVNELPSPGFVGQESPLFRVTEQKRAKLKSTRKDTRRVAAIRAAGLADLSTDDLQAVLAGARGERS